MKLTGERARLVQAFLNYLLVEKNCSPLTIANYERDIKAFVDFYRVKAGTDFTWAGLTVLQIRSYLAFLNATNYARRTVARRISSLRSFYKYLVREGRVEQNPFTKVRTPKLDKRLPTFLEEVEIDEILALPDKSLLGLRDQAVLEMLYATGCRVSELVGLTCGAKTRAGTPCKRKDLYTSARCPLHGGLSTGPTTPEDRATAAENGRKPKRKKRTP